jgi:hypothetical protein
MRPRSQLRRMCGRDNVCAHTSRGRKNKENRKLEKQKEDAEIELYGEQQGESFPNPECRY